MNLINTYLYEITGSEQFKIESFFSTYRINQINSSNNNEIINKMIITEHFLKFVLEKELNKLLDKINITTTKNGKPYLVDENLFFNITHKDNLILIVTSKEEVSIDLEKVNIKHLKIKNKLYSNEVNYSINRIIKDFTIKESYIKFYGLNILTNMKVIHNDNKLIKGPSGTIMYKSFKFSDYYLTIAKKQEFSVNFLKTNELNSNDLINYNKYIKILKSEEEE